MKTLDMKRLVCALFCAVLLIVGGVKADEQPGGGLAGAARLRTDLGSNRILIRQLPPRSTALPLGIRRLVPQQYPTIQSAITASANGDTVLISEGTYLENIRFMGKAIIVASLCLVDGDTTHIDGTIIDGSNPSHPDSASTVYFNEGEDTTSVLYGLTIKGGAGTLELFGASWVRIGGGVYCSGVYGAKIVRNLITRNRIRGRQAWGGGVAISGTPSVTTTLVLERNRIIANHVNADSAYGDGGGVDITYAMFRIVGNVFERDTVVGQTFAVGGAVGIFGEFPTTPANGLISNNLFRHNIVNATIQNALGAGVSMGFTGPVPIVENVFEDNIAISRDGYAEGCGILLEDGGTGFGRKMIVRNRFVGNRSISQNLIGSGGAIELFNTLATVDGNSFSDNSSLGGISSGGAIRIWTSSFRLENNILIQNSSSLGGAISVANPPQSGSGQEIINNTMASNTASSSGGALQVANCQPIVMNSILWSNAPDQIIGLDTVYHSDVQGGWSGPGNINTNPLFVVGDSLFHLLASSPCIGRGIDSMLISGVWHLSSTVDYDGRPRPRPLGTRPDIGAQEDQTVVVSVDEREEIPLSYELHQNYPNPFNPATKFGFRIAEFGLVTLKVYDLLGREVATLVNEEMKPGTNNVEWNASGFASGVYLYRLRAGSFTETRKLLLLR